MDKISNKLLKYAANVLKHPRSALVNKCLNATVVPNWWKIVLLILSGDPTVPKSYCPISPLITPI